jgi:hypothetical protein
MSTKTMSTKTIQRKLCPVCKDAGKPEKEYTSHFVRDKPGPDGKTICPLLLSLNCRKCGKKGHTFKYCKVNVKDTRQEQEKTRPKQEKTRPNTIQKGKFVSLAESSDEEGEEGEEKEEKEEKEEEKVVVMTYADKLKQNQQLPLAPTLPNMFVLRSTILPAPTLLQAAPTLPAPTLLQAAPTLLQAAPTLPAPTLLQAAPTLPEQKLQRAPILPVTEEEKEKIQKLKDGCRKIISQKCKWAETDTDSEEEED